MNNKEEKALVKQIKQKSPKAIDTLLEHYGNTIKSIVYKYIGDFKGCQDECIDDILMAIWTNIDAFDERKGSLQNWIAGISKFKALSCLRRCMKLSNEISLEDERMPEISDVNAKIADEEFSEETEQMLSCLSEKDRKLLIALYAEEESINKVAKSIGVNASAAYKRAERAKIKIRKLFSIERCE